MEKLPAYEELMQQRKDIMGNGYDLVDSDVSPMTGTTLSLMAKALRTPGTSSMMTTSFAKQNKLIELRKFAAFVPDAPLYYPFVEPATDTKASTTDKSLSLVEFSKKGVRPAQAADDDTFKHWSIADYTTRYASREVTPLQVARAILVALERNAKSEFPLSLFVEKHDEEILEQARASTERYARSEPMGVLDGVPVAIKDEIDVRGYRTTMGTPFLGNAGGVAKMDAIAVARLRAAGAMIIGKTNLHERGASVTGYNMHFGTVLNPYDPQCYPGGSSSGSAAAVASGLVPLTLGLDAGGSIRVPAALCGVVGLKPTFQRVPPLAGDCPSVGVVGPIAGCVRDVAIAYAVISCGDATSFAHGVLQPPVRLQAFEDTESLKGVRVGYFPEYASHSAPEIAEAVRNTLRLLAARGAEIVETSLRHLSVVALAHSVTINSEFAQTYDKFYSHFGEMSPEAQIILTYGRTYSAMDFLAAQRIRAFALRQWQGEVMDKVDVFVTPTTAITAPEIIPDALRKGEFNPPLIARVMRFIFYANFVGVPGVAVPCGFDHRGLPMSVQFQAGHWDEDLLLRLANATEGMYAAEHHRPQVYFDVLKDASHQPSE